jgi:hypothetical protein
MSCVQKSAAAVCIVLVLCMFQCHAAPVAAAAASPLSSLLSINAHRRHRATNASEDVMKSMQPILANATERTITTTLGTDASGRQVPLSVEIFLLPQPKDALRRMTYVPTRKEFLLKPYHRFSDKAARLMKRLDMIEGEIKRLEATKENQERNIQSALDKLAKAQYALADQYDRFMALAQNTSIEAKAQVILERPKLEDASKALLNTMAYHKYLCEQWQGGVTMLMDQLLNLKHHRMRLRREISIDIAHAVQAPIPVFPGEYKHSFNRPKQ